MADNKLEPRLLTFIDAQKVRGGARGMSAAEIEEQEAFKVTIAHQEHVRAEEVRAENMEAAAKGQARAAALGRLEQEVSQRQEPILARLAEIGAGPAKQHVLANAVTADLTMAQIRQVIELDEVGLVRLEALDQVTAMNETVEVIEAREVWHELHYTGDDIRVAILDTGIDESHPALLGKVVDRVDTTGTGLLPPGFHATHTAGTVASNDTVYRGVAWKADLVNIKVLTAAGFGQPAWVIDGLDQAVRRDALVASLSLGWSEIYHGWVCNDADCILCQAADNAVRLGVTVVVAAGNEDNLAASFPGKSDIRHPGAARRVITVGAVDKAKVLATFTSIGPGTARLSPGSAIRWTKPDLAAPGVNVVSSVPGGGFAALSGTSMATPHVAGVAALVLEKYPDATPMMVKKLLEDTCEPLTYTPNQAGYGLVNAFGALIETIDVK